MFIESLYRFPIILSLPNTTAVQSPTLSAELSKLSPNETNLVNLDEIMTL